MALRKRCSPVYAFLRDKPRATFKCQQCRVQAFGEGPLCDVCRSGASVARVEMVDRRKPNGYVKLETLHTLLAHVEMDPTP